VPFMIWSPRLYRSGQRSTTIASHVDLAPTIAELAGLNPAPDWQGRSLFDRKRSPRAYFYVAEDGFTLGVREGQWKYLYDLREGEEELYDLSKDPIEWQNVAKEHAALSTRFRQRLAAWTEANRRQYEP
jgi:choline-sulfatase